MNLAYVIENLNGASTKVECPVGDLNILWYFFQLAKCSAKITCNGEYEKLAGVYFTILSLFHISY